MRLFVAAVLAAALTTSTAAENERKPKGLRGKHVLRLCLTTNTSADDAYEKRQASLKKFTAPADVAVDLTFGNDYQTFDWLQKDEIDAGFLSPLAVFLFHHGSEAEITGGSQLHTYAEQNYFFFRPAGSSLSGEISAMMRSVRLTPDGRWAPTDNPLGDYDAFLKQVWSVAQGNGKVPAKATDSCVVVMPSHLSTSGFAAPLLHAVAFFESHTEEERARLAGKFWRAYFDRTVFLLAPSPRDWSSEECKKFAITGDDKKAAPCAIIEFRSDSEPWSAENGWKFYAASKAGLSARTDARPAGDWLVLNKAFDSNLGKIEGYEQVKPDDLDWAAKTTGLGQVRQALRGPGGAQPWAFPFTIAELLRLLERDQQTSKVAKLALVLPGGGVKACYQSTLIDHLYGNHQLANRPSAAAPDALLVSCVCGNSGGALLGSFVAALKPDKQVALSPLLWFPGGKPVGSNAIFPYWDMPRWLTVFASCAVFAFVLGLTFFVFKIKPAQPGADTDEESRFWYSVMWAGYLALIPLGFKYVNGSFGVEHVPAIAGFVYFFCLCIALGGDSCFVVCKSRTGQPAVTLSRRAISFALTGTLIAFLPILMKSTFGWKTENSVFYQIMPWASMLYCAGALLLLGGMVLAMLDQPTRFRRHKSIDFLSGIGVLFIIPVVTFVILEVTARLKMVTLLELTISFWKGLLLTSFFVSVAVVSLGISGRKKSDWRQRLYVILEYLWSVHPTQSLNAPRLVRVLIFGLVGWSWWNFVVAPAVYGNDFARKFFKGRVAEFYGVAPEKLEDNYADLQTSLIVPATALITGEERYFLFSPDPKNDDQEFFKGVASRRGHDGRWRGFSKQVPLDYLIDFVFASGSPFPIFPAHLITYRKEYGLDLGPQDSKPEWLIDGGYAHNVPIEAASDAGARQVLVLENSPLALPHIDKPQAQVILLAKYATVQLPPKTDPGDEPPLALRSQLISNLPRLLPFMYGRSQSADEQSRAGMFVAALAPSYAGSWPLLTDFRKDIVERMRQAAENDCDQRIGTVQSWGPPRFFRPP